MKATPITVWHRWIAMAPIRGFIPFGPRLPVWMGALPITMVMMTIIGLYYEYTGPNPCKLAGRQEHSPDCIGDFIGLNQNKWNDLNGECAGNINGFCFNFWDASGDKRWNYVPPLFNSVPIRDIQSGIKAWTEYRGSRCDVFSQLTDFNPQASQGKGFTFEDVKNEINSGYPILLFLQSTNQFSRDLPGMPNANPEIHGVLAYGYTEFSDDVRYVRIRDSWAGGGNRLFLWTNSAWFPDIPPPMTVRGVIGYHPQPQITSMSLTNGVLFLQWEGPSSVLYDASSGTSTSLHWYVVEKSSTLAPARLHGHY